jgi:DNA-binding LacI/PurR family transcriptional regulator
MEALTLHCNCPRVKESEIKKTERRRDGGKALPTIAEVARLATVSTATVSRVVNGSPSVRPATRDAVLEAIEHLGYTPNRAARTLVTRRTDTIALVVSESETRVFSDPFFPRIVRGVSTALRQTELQLLLLMARDAREHAKVERYVRHGHVDGVILMSLHGDDPLPKTLPQLVPTVLVGRPRAGERLPWVDADNRGGARAATEHLLTTGKKSVATVTGPLDMTVGVDRFEGYRDALRAGGHRFRRTLVAHGDFGKESGARAIREIAERVPDVDAVFLANDPMAIGALEALRSLGRRVPEDVAVIGFDDVDEATLTDPPLTTVSQPLEQMTGALAELLLRRMRGLGDEDESVVCPTHLVLRAST